MTVFHSGTKPSPHNSYHTEKTVSKIKKTMKKRKGAHHKYTIHMSAIGWFYKCYVLNGP